MDNDAVIYARYSSHNQRDCSIEQQVADCEAYAKLNGLNVVGIYADRHLSGTNDRRPQFQQLLKDAAHGGWKAVICWKIDRFARNRYDSATYKFRLKKHGVRVLYAKESIPDGPEGILLESVLEGSAEYYSAALSQNIKRGMMYNAQECKVNSGAIPYGYCKGSDGRYAVKEAEAEIVREIFGRVAAGEPFVEIANDLNARGIRTGRGNRWNKGSFGRMLHNEQYIGVYRFADVRIEGGVPAIIDPVIFWEVDNKLRNKKNPQGRHRENGDYLLTGKLKCAYCDSFMVGVSGTGRNGLHRYYVCHKRRTEKACNKENVRADWIERTVVQATLDYVLQPEVIEWIADAVIAYQERDARSATLAALEAERTEVTKAINNVMAAIEAGIITATTKRRLVELEARADELSRSIELERASHTRLERDQIIFWLEQFRCGSVNDQAFRRKVVDTFVSVVYLADDHLRVAFNYSGDKNEIGYDIVMDAEAVAGADGSYMVDDAPPERSQTNQTNIYFVGIAFVLVSELHNYH